MPWLHKMARSLAVTRAQRGRTPLSGSSTNNILEAVQKFLPVEPELTFLQLPVEVFEHVTLLVRDLAADGANELWESHGHAKESGKAGKERPKLRMTRSTGLLLRKT